MPKFYDQSLISTTGVEVKNYRYDWVIRNYGLLHNACSVESSSFAFNDYSSEFQAELTISDNKNYFYLHLINGSLPKNTCVDLSLMVANEENSVIEVQTKKLNKLYQATPLCKMIVISKEVNFETLSNCLSDGTLIVRFEITFYDVISDPACSAYKQESQVLPRFSIQEKLFGDKKFSDARIIVGDQIFDVHKCILSAGSAYFSAMFESDMKEKIENQVVISDGSQGVMQEILRFIYTGKVKDLDALKMDLYIASDKYMIEDLKILKNFKKALKKDGIPKSMLSDLIEQ